MPWLRHFENILSREMRGRLFVISEAGSDGTNTSQTATYKCLVSECVSLPVSSPVTTLHHSPPHQTILNFTKWQVSPLAAVSQSVWNQFPEVWCKPERHNFCLLADDWWWDRSVFNQRYLGPLESWNKMFYCREHFLLRPRWMNGELYRMILSTAKLLIDTSESQWLIFPSIFISLKYFLHCILQQQVPLEMWAEKIR